MTATPSIQPATAARAVLSALAALLLTSTLAAQPPQGGPAPHELIVLLAPAPDAPTPETVVESSRRGEALPAGLGAGGSTDARFMIPQRARGEAAEAYRLDPDRPSALLQRYVVLAYPETANLDAVARALERNPAVLWVGDNPLAELSVEPNDPRFDDDPGGVPRPAGEHQWGSYALSLPEAWDRAKGHGYVGVIDTGIQADHPDLRPFDALGNYVGGNFRAHLSYDYGNDDSTVDDGESISGHGTHVSGIVAARANNGIGVAGACWECSVMMGKVAATGSKDSVVAAINGMIANGAEVLNLSLGYRPGSAPDCVADPFDPLCTALNLADQRDTIIAAAAGNDATSTTKPTPDFPAIDPRVIGAAGLEQDGTFWNDCDQYSFECGSNADPTMLTTPAQGVLSTFYEGLEYAPSIGCTDAADGTVDGYGPCSGTSMSSPYMTASAAILRSANPLLSKDDVKTLLVDNIENVPGWDSQDAVGTPNVAEALHDALGRVGGAVLDNRLTPLFNVYSFTREDWAYTTFPQVGSSLTRGFNDYRPGGTDVPGYTYFPGGNCLFVPCPATAEVYVFSTDRSPNGHPLVPLYRLSFEGTFPGGPSNPDNADHNYTTEAAGIEVFAGVGYDLDGVEGYIYERCSPEPSCIPAGATRLYRYYNATLDDWALFPESQLATFVADGYSAQPGANPWIGYVYENVDSDGDAVIDGFEGLIGTNPNAVDSDGDGLSDGDEILQFPYSDPLVGPVQTIGELGQISYFTNTLRTITFSRTYTAPVVIAQPISFRGSQQAVVRITSVTPTSFTFYVDEAPNLDGSHTSETVTWMVLEAGSWVLPDGTPVQAGRFNTSQTIGHLVTGGGFFNVSFPDAFDSVPVVMSQVQSDNDPSWVKTRQRNSSATGFQVALEPEEAQTTFHGTETIGWFAMQPGVGTWSGHAYQAGDSGQHVTDGWATIGFTQSFANAPGLLASLASRFGGDNAAIRYTGLGASSVQVKVEEETTADSEVAHVAENVHYLAIEGTGTLQAAPRP